MVTTFATSSVVVFIVSQDTTGSNMPLLSLDYAQIASALRLIRPPLALPYVRMERSSDAPVLYFGKRAVAAWQSRRM